MRAPHDLGSHAETGRVWVEAYGHGPRQESGLAYLCLAWHEAEARARARARALELSSQSLNESYDVM